MQWLRGAARRSMAFILTALLSVGLVPSVAIGDDAGLAADSLDDEAILVEDLEANEGIVDIEDQLSLDESSFEDDVPEEDFSSEDASGVTNQDEDDVDEEVRALTLDVGSGVSGTCGTCIWSIDADGLLVIRPANGQSGQLASADELTPYSEGTQDDSGAYTSLYGTWYFPWGPYHDQIMSVRVEPGVKAGKSIQSIFAKLENCVRIDASNLDMSETTNAFFCVGGGKLKYLDMSSWKATGIMHANSDGSYTDGFPRWSGDGGGYSLEYVKVGSEWQAGIITPNRNENGFIWSKALGRWLTYAEVSSRFGIADTYTTYPNLDNASIAVQTQTYTGQELRPAVTVTVDGTVLQEGSDYSVTYSNNVNAGTATVTATGRGKYYGKAISTFTIAKAAQAISAANKSVAMGKTVKLGARRTKGNGKLTYKSSNTKVAKVSATGVVTPVKVGKVTITITAAATANYKAATKKVTVTVAKGAQPMAVKAVARAASLKTLKSKAVTVARPISFTKAPQGKLAYAKVSGSGALTISKTTGKVTVKKGTKKGAYSIKVKITAAGNANWKAGSKTLICKVVVK